MACYQAEVLYYNLLPKPAIANLDAAMEIAEASGKLELEANCENYYALFHIIDQKPRDGTGTPLARQKPAVSGYHV